MSFITTLIGLVQNLDKTGMRQAVKYAAKSSALPPGRMCETDQTQGRKSPLPAKPGLYRHIDKDSGKVLYVGQTDNLRKRQQEHVRGGRLTSKQYVQYAVAKPMATKDGLCDTEKAHIGRHKPSGNTTKGGNGRR